MIIMVIFAPEIKNFVKIQEIGQMCMALDTIDSLYTQCTEYVQKKVINKHREL
jgi:hypothetical protein